MSDTTTSSNAPVDILTDDDFDKIFEAEQAGNHKERREAIKEVDARITNTPPPVVVPAAPEGEPNDPAPSPDQTAPAADPAPPATPNAAPADNQDWLASLDPTIKANVEKLLAEKAAAEQAKEQYIRSNEGRIAAEQRKAQQLEQRLREATQKAVQAPQKTPATQPKPETNAERLERLRALKEADELTGGLIEETIAENERIYNEFNSLKQMFESQKTEQERRYIESEVSRVRAAVPNYEEVLNSEWFNRYLNEVAPRSVYEAYQTPTADSTLYAIQAYGVWAQQQNDLIAAQQNGQGNGGAATTQALPAATAQAQKTQAERDRKVNAGPVNNGVTRPSAVPSDPLEGVLNDPKKTDRFHDELFEKELKRLRGE